MSDNHFEIRAVAHKISEVTEKLNEVADTVEQINDTLFDAHMQSLKYVGLKAKVELLEKHADELKYERECLAETPENASERLRLLHEWVCIRDRIRLSLREASK